MRVLLRQDCASGDELRAYGAVPVPVRDGGSGAIAGDASAWTEPQGVGRAARSFVSGGSVAVPASVLWAVDYDGEPCGADGRDDAGDPAGGGSPVRASACGS